MAVKKGSNLRRRVVAARFRKLQFVNQQVAAKSASKNCEAIRPAATINADNEFGKHARIQDSGFRAQKRGAGKVSSTSALTPETHILISESYLSSNRNLGLRVCRFETGGRQVVVALNPES
jgi:hypothetical protein